MRQWALYYVALLLCFVPPARAAAPCGVEASACPQIAVHLGDSFVSLNGPWRFHVGDDPAWAAPGLDDSQWETVSLAPPSGDPNDLVPGWTTQGHPAYAGFAWYRLRVSVTGAEMPLSLRMPDAVDDAYQVFVNGQPIGQFGEFHGSRVRAYAGLPQGFALPSTAQDGSLVIAVRVWMDSATRFFAPDAGGLHAAPVLGLQPVVAGQVRLDWDDHAHLVGSGFLETLVLLLALVVAVTHFALARHEKAYLWLALAVLVTLIANVVLQVVNFTTVLPQTPAILVRDVLLAPARLFFWIVFWASWFGLARQRRLAYLAGGLALLLAGVVATLRPPLHGQVISLHTGSLLSPVALWLKLGLAGLLLFVAFKGIQQDRADGLLALPALLLAAIASYQHELHLLHVPVTFTAWGFLVSLGQISTMLSLLLVTALGSMRFLRAQRRKVQLSLEMQQARELQRVILPSTLPAVPGFRMESDYRPSREVGGDFFQILPSTTDGSVLVVIGDVTGKGLCAGMLVALIVGSADALAPDNPYPEQLLARLNERLCERGYATATCLAMRIDKEGVCSIANAGHPPPYLNGQELEIEGALPLGTLSGMEYTPFIVKLAEGDALTLITDGVAEAQDAEGALFGFERVGAMLAERASVHEVAEAAAAFGQEDDILVLRVERRTASEWVSTPAAA